LFSSFINLRSIASWREQDGPKRYFSTFQGIVFACIFKIDDTQGLPLTQIYADRPASTGGLFIMTASTQKFPLN
ncbi:MAG: hypothetical protein AAFV07_17040, partial [Bacteroidota bacterium]